MNGRLRGAEAAGRAQPPADVAPNSTRFGLGCASYAAALAAGGCSSVPLRQPCGTLHSGRPQAGPVALQRPAWPYRAVFRSIAALTPRQSQVLLFSGALTAAFVSVLKHALSDAGAKVGRCG